MEGGMVVKMADQKDTGLANSMKIVLASSFSFYLKAHNFHWNVEGPNFPQYHALFNTLYTEVWGAVDLIAEHIRALDNYAPGSYTRFKELSIIEDETNIPNAQGMLSKLISDNQKLIAQIKLTQKAAEQAEEVGLANFLQDRIDIHQKHAWMLRATQKGNAP